MEQDQRLTPLPKAAEIRAASTGAYPSAYPAFYDDELVEGKVSIKQYINVVYKRLPLILALAIVVTAATAFYMYQQPSQYTATTQMIIEPRRPKMTSKDSININFGQDANYYQTQLRLLQGPELMREVVIRTGLYREPNLFEQESKGMLTVLQSLFSSGKSDAGGDALPMITDVDSAEGKSPVALSPEEEKRVNEYTGKLAAGLAVNQIERTNLVTVSVTSTNPQVAAKVSTQLAKIFKAKDAERETAGARKAYDDLTNSIDELRGQIAAQENELLAELRSNELPLQDKGQDLAASRLTSLSETWLKSMESRRTLESQYNAAAAASARGEGASIPQLTESKIYQDAVRLSTERKAKLQDDIRGIEKQIQTAETEKAELLVRYTPEFDAVKKMDERIASLQAARQKMEKEVSEIIERDKKAIDKDAVSGALVSLRSQLESKRREEAQALAAYEREAASANIQGQAQTKLTTLKRQIETNRNLLDTYIQRQKEQELAIANTEPDNIKIPMEAAVPARPVGPARERNIMMAFVVSLLAGIGLAFLLDYLDDSVKSSDDISRHLGLPTLALIPHYISSERRKLLSAGAAAPVGPSTSLITLEERNSPMAEAYRHLRTSLLFSSAGRPPQSILVTSSQPSEGKTTTAVNTAITLAQAGTDVVIIDCDLRRPRLHSYFDLENTKGLTNYLSGERNTENLIKQCRDLPTLKVITSGPIPPNPTELLSSNEMKNLLQFLRGRYKHIVIDSPPAISFTDAAILSTVVDGVVLVAMANKSSIHLMRRFKQRLATLGARIYGVVLNGLKSGSVEYDYYGSGYYDYYRSADDDVTTPVMETESVGASTNGKH